MAATTKRPPSQGEGQWQLPQRHDRQHSPHCVPLLSRIRVPNQAYRMIFPCPREGRGGGRFSMPLSLKMPRPLPYLIFINIQTSWNWMVCVGSLYGILHLVSCACFVCLCVAVFASVEKISICTHPRSFFLGWFNIRIHPPPEGESKRMQKVAYLNLISKILLSFKIVFA